MFCKFERVEMTDEAKEMFPKVVQTGYVSSIRNWPDAIRVRRDGIKNAETWHPKYWKSVYDPMMPVREGVGE